MPVTPVTVMPKDNYDLINNTEEPSVFKGKEPDEKIKQKVAEKAKKASDTAGDLNKVADELMKFNIVEEVFDELMQSYDFISVEEKLYVYVKEFGYWKLITDSESQRELRRRVDRKWRGRINKNNLQELYEWLILDARHIDSSRFREGRHYLNFSDVAYNWKKDKVTKDRKALYFRYALKVPFKCKYDESGAFQKFLTDIFDTDKNSLAEFQKFIGLALSDIRTLKYAFVFYGPSNTGKSVTMNLLRYLVGAENTASVSFSQMSSEFHTAQLHNRRINCSAEVSGVTLSRLDVFRALCGNDEILVSNKMKDPFGFINRCLLLFSCNVLPKISDPMEAQSVVERLIIFPFNNVKKREEWEPKLAERLFQDYPSVIEFAIEGLRLLEKDDYTIKESPEMLRCKEQYAGTYDSFSLFAQEYIQASKDTKIASARIKETYHRYCTLKDCQELNDNVWGQMLKRDFDCVSCTMSDKSTGQSHRVRAYQGITLKKDIEKLFNEKTPEMTLSDILKC